MDTHLESDYIAQRLLECFNSGSVSTLSHHCDRSLTVNSSILGSDRRSNALIDEPIAALIAACRVKFPGVRFHNENIRPSAATLELDWSAHFKSDDRSGRTLSIPCVCRVQLVGGRLRELSFAVDEYAIQLQLGRICSDPGQSAGNSAAVNHLAIRSLQDGLAQHKAIRDPLHSATLLHVSIQTYRNLDKGAERDTFRLEGADQFGELLRFIRSTFGDPLDLSFDQGISHGYTTTFRGKIRARVRSTSQRYNIVCGFASTADQVDDCWVKITPPPTLMECLI